MALCVTSAISVLHHLKVTPYDEMGEILKCEWTPQMNWNECIVLKKKVDDMLQKIRIERQIMGKI